MRFDALITTCVAAVAAAARWCFAVEASIGMTHEFERTAL